MKMEKYQNGFQYAEHEQDLQIPLQWKRPRKVFVNSMSDLFHEKATIGFIKKCFATMIRANHHTYQVLTKRPEKMREFSCLFHGWCGSTIPSHIWMGVSVENKGTVWRIDELRKVDCKSRFISFEPLLGEIGRVDLTGIDWAIIGGESGVGYREVKGEWISNLIRECEEQNVPVFFKQWGGIRPKSNGREINGRTYDCYPMIDLTEEEWIEEELLKYKIESLGLPETVRELSAERKPNLIQIAAITKE